MEPSHRIGDADRSDALDRLGTYFADGYLDIHEFDARSGQAAVATTAGDLSSLFDDLPQQSAIAKAPSRDLDAEAELDSVLDRHRKAQAAHGIIWAVTMVLFFLGLFVFHWDYFWVVFPIAGLASWGASAAFGLSDEEEELAEELAEKENEERADRLRIAAERRRELGK